MGTTTRAHASAKLNLQNSYAIEEHTATPKFYPRENFPLRGIFGSFNQAFSWDQKAE